MATKYIVSDSAIYSKYVANLTQTGVTPPTAEILENTLNEVPTYSYSGTGEYTINFLYGFTPSRTYIFIGGQATTQDGVKVYANTSGSYSIDITTLDNTNTKANDILLDTTIEIRFY